jgi:hypothetical protein
MTGFISKPKTPFGEIALEQSTTRHSSTSPEYKLKYCRAIPQLPWITAQITNGTTAALLSLHRQNPRPNPNPLTFGLRDDQFIECVKQVQRRVSHDFVTRDQVGIRVTEHGNFRIGIKKERPTTKKRFKIRPEVRRLILPQNAEQACFAARPFQKRSGDLVFSERGKSKLSFTGSHC